MEHCIIDWEIHTLRKEPYIIKTDYDYDKIVNRGYKYKYTSNELPTIGRDIIGYDKELNKYKCYRSRSYSNDIIIWKDSITTEPIDVNILIWKYEEILWI